MDPRHEYLDHAGLTAVLQRWAADHPDLVRLTSLATTPEGRELWLLTLGPEPDRVRPSMLVDGNMHAAELAGSSVCLGFAHDVLRVHLGEDVHGLSPALLRAVRECLVYVVPRMSPDGAESVLKTGRYVRSAPRDHRHAKHHAHWINQDLDGDGLAFVMRVQDPTGELVESTEVPGLLVGRTLDDDGPFYKVYPEGIIASFDGFDVPSPDFLSDTQTDFNRNFPFGWAPPHVQVGAGAFPASEPEVAAMVRFTTAHPEIFCWVNYHCFGGVVIRPLGDQPDSKLPPGDLALLRLVEQWATDFTGYPTVPGVEFVYAPDTPLHGDLVDYAWHQRGALSWVVELWDLFEEVGLPKADRFVDRYTRLERAELEALARWDAEHNEGRILRPWTPFRHPQLGDVEIGGLDPRVGLWNPPPDRLPGVVDAQSRMLLHAAALTPRLQLDVDARLDGDHLHLTLVVENHGYLSTRFIESAAGLEHNEPLTATVITDGEVLGPRRVTVGHLDGWGRGRWDGSNALYFQRTRGSTGRRTVCFDLRGASEWRVTVGSCRVGWWSFEG
ncbi:MAG: peptidase M14 [Alphaproteobacteria bacterium]|nr:peptidase M14 [Alphaproteobacteria bacterium]MCB9694068.1 peptidase M14 [Alphaproteobacteria bacterium]